MRKSYRVKKEAEFQTVFTQGKSSANRQFVIYMLEKPDQAHFRVGISVGKKIGNAVARNWVKRRIRQSLTELKPQLKQDCDFLVIARPAVANMSMVDVKEHLVHALRLAKVLDD
ncbi:MAG: ribonuclease P protein component [Coriobacteriales bacterium]|uniref:Ribonuclease P protein component n=1 Tax=Ligilactobacillus hayakitensis DSM 18933 = JCM 14209 TaxID=1423755 RepID=A0A0R1WNM4_9LACO|nr:ribonuclease P protein component [Ligilactobacillus hayakitensis]KRM19528.1 ribonuclease P [Ligilactobacillus hayakitensis DSM 18933 = JCM 14209]MCQ2752618.1 ribonuclease P protein component [Coriobacteriales bacterium]